MAKCVQLLLVLGAMLLCAAAVAEEGSGLAGIRAFAAQRGLAERQEGDRALRVIWFGCAPTPAGAVMLKHGMDALGLADAWTGGQRFFTPDAPADQAAYWLVMLPDNASVFALVDHLRANRLMPEVAGGQDLYKTCPGWPLGPIFVYSLADLAKRNHFSHYAAYAAACLAVDTYYSPQALAPSWIREGFATEVQRSLLQTVLFTTVSYEMSNTDKSPYWMQDTAQIIKGKTKGVKPLTAEAALSGGIEAIPFTTYRQYCNLFAFLRDASQAERDAKGAGNRLAKVMAATRSGTSSLDAAAAVFGVTEPKLTAAWHAWAVKQR